MNAPFSFLHRAEAAPEMNGVKTTDGVLADLRSQRVRLADRLAEIRGILGRLEAAEDCEREALAAIGELGLAEIAAVKDWAAAGCLGDAPSPDMQRRDALNRTFGQAMANSEAQRAVAADLRGEEREVTVGFVALNERIEAAALDVIARKFEAELGAMVAVGRDTQERMGRIYGAVHFLRATGEGHQGAGRTAKAVSIFNLIERFAKLEKPEFLASVEAVERAAPRWREMFEGLIK
jgi:hypothetical protein